MRPIRPMLPPSRPSPSTGFTFRPRRWSKSSTLFAALGWFASIYLAARAGGDVTQGSFLNVIAAPLLAVLPMVAAQTAYLLSRESQRVGDATFAIVMVGQGLFLIVDGAMMQKIVR